MRILTEVHGACVWRCLAEELGPVHGGSLAEGVQILFYSVIKAYGFGG
jgi:hypothetical protein